jgi:hypothetical protein
MIARTYHYKFQKVIFLSSLQPAAENALADIDSKNVRRHQTFLMQ